MTKGKEVLFLKLIISSIQISAPARRGPQPRPSVTQELHDDNLATDPAPHMAVVIPSSRGGALVATTILTTLR